MFGGNVLGASFGEDASLIDTAIDWGVKAAETAGGAVRAVTDTAAAAQQRAEDAYAAAQAAAAAAQQKVESTYTSAQQKVAATQEKLASGGQKIQQSWEKSSGITDVPTGSGTASLTFDFLKTGSGVTAKIAVPAPVGTPIGAPGTTTIAGKPYIVGKPGDPRVLAQAKANALAKQQAASSGLPWWAWAGIFVVGGVVVVNVVSK